MNWNPVKDYEDLYEVSENGLVRSKLNNKLKSQALNNNGYYRVELYKLNERKRPFVHRLVAECFVKNSDPDKFNTVNHLDGDRLNNKAANLEWTNKSGNQKHAIKMGFTKMPLALGEKNNNSKLSKDQVIQIRLLKNSGKKVSEIASVFNVTTTNIYTICNGRGWKHVK